MKRSQFVFIIVLLVALLAIGMAVHTSFTFGGVPWFGWIGFVLLANFMAVGLVFYDTGRRKSRVFTALKSAKAPEKVAEAKAAAQPSALDPDGPPYPHPVINA